MTDRRKKELSDAYRILAHLGLDDHTYTHLSIRAKDPDYFHMYPFGYRFEEVTPECLLTISQNGQIKAGEELFLNRTGYVIHGSVYQARPDIQAIFHIHAPSIVAVSCLKEGLLPLNQWALHFYERVAYHAYDSLALDAATQGQRLVQDLGNKSVMLMRHHGSITCGRTIQEALFYTYHLEKACQTQCLTLAMNREIEMPSPESCKRTVQDLLHFEKDLGARDWAAWVRVINKK
jgi:ribulose-5-phosphate 4-epimerase/fuculose-1-phosphate aldolase